MSDADRAAMLALIPKRANPEGWTDRTWLGFESTKIGPDEVAEVSATPRRPFRGDRIAVGVRFAPNFIIHRIQVGTSLAGVAYGGFPADLCATRLELLAAMDATIAVDGSLRIDISELALDVFGLEIALPIAQVGMQVTLIIQNVHTEPSRFLGVVLGTTPPSPGDEL